MKSPFINIKSIKTTIAACNGSADSPPSAQLMATTYDGLAGLMDGRYTAYNAARLNNKLPSEYSDVNHTHSYQAADADLLAIGGLADGATGFLNKTAANTWTLTDIADIINASKLASWPIGSIYCSISPSSPSTLFGGTWVAFGTGYALVGFKEGDSNFGTVEGTVGDPTVTLAVTQIPGHNHTINHTHGSFTSQGQSVSHSHGFSLSADSAGSHSHSYTGNFQPANGGTDDANWSMPAAGDAGATMARDFSSYIGSAGAHTHTVSGSISNTTTDHTHSITVSAYNGTSGDTGGGLSHNNIQPSITVYMWKRTA